MMASVRPRKRADGTIAWQVIWRQNRRQTSATFNDEKAAQTAKRYIDTTGHLPPFHQHSPITVTVTDAVTYHIDNRVEGTDATRHDYRRILDLHITPTIGHVYLDDLTRETLAGWIRGIRRSDKTLRNIHGLLSAALETAVERRWVERNVAAGMRLPRRTDHQAADMVFLTHDQYARLHEALPPFWRPFVMFLAGTGTRFGEATAVTAADVRLDRHPQVSITKAWKPEPGSSRRYLGPTKTRRSRRTIALPPELVDVMRPLVDRKPSTGLVFTTPRGSRIDNGHFWERQWQPAVKAAGLTERPRIHDLRHTHVSWLIAAGIQPAVIQARLGHESITTTMDRYGHLFPDAQQAAADAASLAFGGISRRRELEP